ncbi:MAG: flagellar basal body-associated FliL family protein [Rubellimicrobium sp.]|nr:flagellar basal body-associated FliL family protein [Rubellimicrobium sp.]
MSEATDPEAPKPRKALKLPLIIGLVLALAGGAAGFQAVRMGALAAPSADEPSETPPLTQLAAAAYLPLDTITVNLADPAARRFLRFTAQLEVPPAHLAEVEALTPRIVDVLNGYLRAIPVSDLEDPAALIRLRAQMLRRVQVVTGQGRVNDLLVMEFIIN